MPVAVWGLTISSVAAVGALIGFILPWVSLNFVDKDTASGLDLAGHGAGGLWLVPAAMVVALLASLIARNKPIEDQHGLIMLILVAAGLSAAIMLFYFASFSGLGGGSFEGIVPRDYHVEFGAVLSGAGVMAAFVGGCRQLPTKSSP